MTIQILPKAFHPSVRIRAPRFDDRLLDDVEGISFDGAGKVLDEFLNHLKGFGVNPRRNPVRLFPDGCLAIMGSVRRHTDDGLGCVATAVIACSSHSMRDSNLVKRGFHSVGTLETTKESKKIHINRVFVFDANNKHSWLSSRACIIVQAMISRKSYNDVCRWSSQIPITPTEEPTDD